MTHSITFTRHSVTINGIEHPADYSVTPSGKVCMFTEFDGKQARISFAQGQEHYEAALAAATSTDEPELTLEQIDALIEAERKAQAEKWGEQKAQREARKAENALKYRKTENPVDKPWIGLSLKSKGWEIVLGGDGYDKIRVIFKRPPCKEFKELVKAHGFYYSPALQSWNRNVTCKGFAAAQALDVALKTCFKKPISA